MGRKKITEDLSVRTCKNGHFGEYVVSSKGHAYCRACARVSMDKFRQKQTIEKPQTIEKLVKKSVYDLEMAKAKVARIQLELQLAELEVQGIEQRLRLINTNA